MVPAAQCFTPIAVSDAGPRLRCGVFEVEEARGVCVLLNGQTEFIEKYFEVIDELRQRGLAVVAMDWRGQGGSQRLLPDPLKAHVEDFAHYDSDLDALIEKLARPLAQKLGVPMLAMAHSMGGHLLVRRLHDRQGEFAFAALCAPMIVIQPRGTPWWVVEKLSRFINRHAPSTEFVWGMAKRDQRTLPFAANIVTSDPLRYARTRDFLIAHSDLRVAGPTWGWLGAALGSIALLHSDGYAEAITTPTLLLAAGHDQVCDSDALARFGARMPNARLVCIAGAEHEILMERDVFRAQLWAALDDFMADITKRPRV